MNKQEFLNQLEKKLDRINETERKDILMEYGTYIDDKMATGVSEEDAVSGFGDVDELAEEILDAYKINTDNVQTKVDKTLDKVYVRSESLLNRLGNLSVNDFFHIVFDAFVLLIILFIGKVLIVDLLGNLFISLLFSFSGGYLYFIEKYNSEDENENGLYLIWLSKDSEKDEYEGDYGAGIYFPS